MTSATIERTETKVNGVPVEHSDSPSDSVSDDVQSYIPESDVFAKYVGRDIAGKGYVDVFDHAKAKHLNVLIEGPTGSGKTHACRAYAALRKMPFFTVSSSVGLEPSQLFGKYIPDEINGGFVWQDGPVTSVVRHGGVLLLNEVNFIPERIATVLFSLLDHRREIQLVDRKGETVKAHPDLVIFADLNPDYEGTRPLNKAFRNRFALQITWDYDERVESKLVESKALLQLAKQMRKQVATGELETPVSTNAMMEFEHIREALGLDYAVYNYVQHFGPDERDAVEMLFRTHRANLEREYQTIDLRKQREAERAAREASGEGQLEIDTFDTHWGVDMKNLEWVYDASASS